MKTTLLALFCALTLAQDPISIASAMNLHGHGGEKNQPWTFDWYVDMAVTFFCLVISGFMSGLTIGLASIDELTLEIAAKQSESVAKKATTIFKVIK